MFYVGLDIHVKWTTVCVLDCDGKLHQRCEVDRDSIKSVRSLLRSGIRESLSAG